MSESENRCDFCSNAAALEVGLTQRSGTLQRPQRIDYSRLGTLREKIPEGHPTFHIRTFRERPYDPSLRN